MAEFAIKEQQTFQGEQKQSLQDLNLVDVLDVTENDVKFLGLNPYNCSVSYYVGIDWLKDEHYILVQPKIDGLDHIKMFWHILNHPEISKFVSSIYHFDFKQPKIKPCTQPEIDFNLFLIAHFLKLCRKITDQGLKKNYIQIEENLSKIKGKIIWSQQIKKNIAGKREDRTFCRYQEYSVNCPENRLLKKTLLMVQRYLKHFDKDQTKPLTQQQNQVLHAFENVSGNISYSQIKMLKVNSLYKEYVDAIDLAKKIMQKFGYSFANTKNKEKQKEISPFWIDMSKLFELYVYSLLRDEYGKEILYQAHGEYGYVDFLKKDEKLIIDAKYKEVYCKNGKYNPEDIRQVSGYARDRDILKKLNITSDNEVVDCVIIFPTTNTDASTDFKNRNLKETEITQFTKFWKCGIKLPIK
jgi:5-methylcytosine-specific restriction enzyme subunit McrC